MPPTKNYQSLASRLTFQNLMVIAFSLVVAGALSFALFWTMMMQRIESSSLLHATQLANQVEIMVVFEDKTAATLELKNHAGYRAVKHIFLYKKNGDLFTSWPENLDVTPLIQPNLTLTEPQLIRENAELSIAAPVIGKGSIEGFLYINEHLEQEYSWFYRLFFGQLALVSVVFITAGLWLGYANRRSFKPLLALTNLATDISNNRNFKLRATIYEQDDIGQLSSHFNELLKRLEFWQKDLHQQLAEQQAHGEAMQVLAHNDDLTGINNRLTFNQHLSSAFIFADEHNQKMALLFIDLDKFKFVNDTYGHKAGDKVLITVAQRLTECIREHDDCYRLGGDEFAVIMRGISNREVADQLAARILHVISQQIKFEQQVLPIGCSIGIAIYPDNADSTSLLFELADKAMYDAKHLGRNCYVRYGATQ